MGARSEKIQKVILVIISVLLAFFLWLYVMGEENPVQTKELSNVPVVLTNMDSISQDNLALIPDQNFTMDLTLTGRAFDLSKISLNDIKVEADMNVGLKKGVNNIPIKITYPQNRINIVTKNKATYINVKLDKLIEKKVPVIVSILGKVRDGYGYTKPIVRPSEVIVSGPSKYVESVLTANGKINITGNHTLISGSILVVPQDKSGMQVPHVNISTSYVDATIAIKPSKEVPIKINTYGVVENGKILKQMKAQLERIVIIGDSRYLNQINEINTNALDLSKISKSTTIQLPINLPMGVTSVDNISNVKIDITLENRIEKAINYSVELKNKSQDFNYTMSSDYIAVTLSGPQSIMNTIDDTSLTPYIDAANLTEGIQTLPVTVGQIDGIEIKSITPADIQIDVTRK